MQKPLKIGVLGPESTGKSTLCTQLQELLQERGYAATVVPEYARTYVEQLGRPYTYSDVCLIAERNRREAQLATPDLRQNATASMCSDVCLFDTDLIITAVWLDEVYGRRPDWLTTPIPEDCRMDCYLILSPDLPWVPDPVRENGAPARRKYLFERYLQEVQRTGSPYTIISGSNRLQQAMDAVIDASQLHHNYLVGL